LAFIAAVVDAAMGGLGATQFLVGALAILAFVTVVGHLLAILSSSRLR
jgi:hypothetical protein